MRFFFDYEDSNGITKDDTGEELPDIHTARDAALRCLAEAIRDQSLAGPIGRLAVRVRTNEAPTFIVAAFIEVADDGGHN